MAGPSRIIAKNRKALYRYSLEDRIEAGLVLEGWEIVSLRAGRVQISDSYVVFRNGEAWLIGAVITPSQHISGRQLLDPSRSRKLLLSRSQINRLAVAVKRARYTCVCMELYWKGHLIKGTIALGKGKKLYDKRESEKRRTLQREQEEAMSLRRRPD